MRSIPLLTVIPLSLRAWQGAPAPLVVPVCNRESCRNRA